MTSAAAARLLLLLLSLAAVHGQHGRRVTYSHYDICAVKESTVNISCAYKLPSEDTIQRFFWFLSDDERHENLADIPQFSGRVTYGCSDQMCTLTIRNLTESDSTEFSLGFTTTNNALFYYGNPGVTLTVTDLQINVMSMPSDIYPCKMSCDVQCQLSSWQSYIWYRNGQKVHDKKTFYIQTLNPEYQYSCSVSGYEGSSPAVYSPRPPTLSQKSSLEISEGDQVTLMCHSDANPPATYSWSKGNQTLDHYQQELVVWSVQSDSVEYFCRAMNLLGESTSHIRINKKCSPTAENISIMNIVRLALVVFLFPPLLAVILWSRKKLSESCIEKPQPVVETSKAPEFQSRDDFGGSRGWISFPSSLSSR
ncbi:cell adhesion molecule CEACAM1-like isoform X2 [Nelusetta ayraudi]|uniref:cell adhesion molecule CEACAM1-like isoform X2 n=1 Tax=Nelusetta ayraudi TaxID=303726 RepID=UPI003F71FDF1